MDTLISQQHVKQRNILSSVTQLPAQKPALYKFVGHGSPTGTHLTVIEQIKQKPVYMRGRLSQNGPIHPRVAAPPVSRQVKPVPQTRERPAEKLLQQRTIIPFILMFMALAVGAVFAFLALNWQKDWFMALLGRAYSLEPGADTGLEQNLIAYTGLSAPLPVTEDIPLNLVETFAWESYVVKRGDSISRIAVNHALSMDAIVASNNIPNAKLLREGEILRIPNMNGIPYMVKKGDTLSKISAGMGVPLEVILDVNDIQSETITPGMSLFIPGAKMRSEDLRLVLGDLFIYPIRGRLTSPFGWRKDPISGVRRYHAAIDLAAAMGTPIKAAMEGRISSVGLNSVYGKYVIISHSNGYQTMYAHLSVVSVNQGAAVSQGSKIGEVGSTGYSTGPHLHFALYKNGRAVNPLDYLNS
ncbi:MAG: M23 family metallopeptidase [Treponema sp.]|jgi:murein DD-endopeptidase MepM/ murein hydrolase activator NlpD|nr:M23 family metallopeptidase [Treponema sp.]